jgi:hypothetical protein
MTFLDAQTKDLHAEIHFEIDITRRKFRTQVAEVTE